MGGNSSKYANQQLRAMFSTISPPSPQPFIFYDQAVHFIEKDWWQPIQSDTSNTTIFAVLADEMYTSHYDTNQFIRVDTMFHRADAWSKDTVVLGLVYYKYCTLKDSALYDTTYFHIDTTGPTIYDNANATSSPYLIDTVFNVCAFQDNTFSGSLTFRVDPDFLFIDTAFEINDKTGRQLQINFDDGFGWQIFPVNTLSFQNVTYMQEGEHVISARVINTQNSNTDAFAMSRMSSPAFDSLLVLPDTTWNNITGIEVGVYPPCAYQTQNHNPKWIIVLEGFDFFESVGTASIYSSTVRSTGLEYLRNYGYGFLTVNWKNSKKSMIDNSMSVVKLIDYLKCHEMGTLNDDPPHQFVIIGKSMGGVIARYALAYMEKNPNFSKCFPNLHHNTRLYISADAPHQGAYLPLAFQEMYYDVLAAAPLPANLALDYFNMQDILDSPSATELLKLHSAATLGSSTMYLPHPNRTLFLDSLVAQNPATGGYPEHVKMIAISNGLLTGERQLGLNDECIMTPGDAYLLTELNVNQSILGVPYHGLHFEMMLRSIKNGQDMYKITLGENKWGIKLKWKTIQKCLWPFGWPCVKFAIPWGVEVGLISVNNRSSSHRANKEPSWDVMPGGNINFSDNLPNKKFHLGLIWRLTIPWFSPPQIPTQCTTENVLSVRLTGLLHSGDLTMTSQGLNFCFIPMQSALDYTGPVDQDHNIYADPTSTIMSRTPFDVVVGEINGLAGYPQVQITSGLTRNKFTFPSYNQDHVTIRNHQLTDSTLQNMQLLGIPPNQLGIHPNYLGLWLNREIGDEEMLLDNLSLDRPALFQAEYDITAGVRTNPYYDYPGAPVQPQFVFRNYGNNLWPPFFVNPYNFNLQNNGIFARDDAFTVESTGTAVLRAQNSINAGGAVVLGFLYFQFQPQWVCDSTYQGGNKKSENRVEPEPINASLYPNPVSSGDQINVQGLTKGAAQIDLIDMQGKLLQSQHMELPEAGNLQLQAGSNLAPGMYFIQVTQNNRIQTFKLLIQ